MPACDTYPKPTVDCVVGAVGGAHELKAGNYGIRINVYCQERYVCGRTQGYRLFMQADCPVNMSQYIFVHQMIAVATDESDHQTPFTNIASPGDMAEYPVGEPGPASPFFRLDSYDSVFRSFDLLVETVKAAMWEIRELLRTLNNMDQLKNVCSVVIGLDGCPNPSSSSSSVVP